jgi:hypothetical protein
MALGEDAMTKNATALPESFRKNGFLFEQVKRRGRWVLLRKRRTGWENGVFEVVRIRTYPEKECFGKIFPARETLPPSESWGTEGFSYSTEEAARDSFAQKCREPQPFARERALAAKSDTRPANRPKSPHRGKGVEVIQ